MMERRTILNEYPIVYEYETPEMGDTVDDYETVALMVCMLDMLLQGKLFWWQLYKFLGVFQEDHEEDIID